MDVDRLPCSARGLSSKLRSLLWWFFPLNVSSDSNWKAERFWGRGVGSPEFAGQIGGAGSCRGGEPQRHLPVLRGRGRLARGLLSPPERLRGGSPEREFSSASPWEWQPARRVSRVGSPRWAALAFGVGRVAGSRERG